LIPILAPACLPLEQGPQGLDDRSAAEAEASATGFLCVITTASAGELTLNLRLYSDDPNATITYEMTGGITVLVGAP
jgi:hypothetical protein